MFLQHSKPLTVLYVFYVLCGSCARRVACVFIQMSMSSNKFEHMQTWKCYRLNLSDIDKNTQTHKTHTSVTSPTSPLHLMRASRLRFSRPPRSSTSSAAASPAWRWSSKPCSQPSSRRSARPSSGTSYWTPLTCWPRLTASSRCSVKRLPSKYPRSLQKNPSQVHVRLFFFIEAISRRI